MEKEEKIVETEKFEDFKTREALFVSELNLLSEKHKIGLTIITTDLKK